MSAGSTPWVPRANGTNGTNGINATNGTDLADGGRLAVANGRAHAPRTVAALCEQFAEVCESAVDPLEIASALELEGLGDQAAKVRYGYRDVFALAQDMYFRVPRRPAEPELPPDPWQGSSGIRPALHSLLYALPGVCFPAAVTLLIGAGVEITLIVALLAAWSLGQGLAYLGYTRLGRTLDMAQAKRVLRGGLAIGLAVIVLAMVAIGRFVHAPTSALLFGAGEGVYMLGAGVLLVLGAELWLMLALAPGVLGSAAFLYLGRPAHLQHLMWIGLVATPLLALLLAVIFTRGAASSGDGSTFLREEWIGAIPAVGFGLVAAGLLIFPVAAGPHGHGGINVGALLAALPLSLSMGAAEACLLWYRRRTQRLLRTIRDIRAFGLRARLILLAAVAMYLAAAVVLMAATVEVAGRTGLARPELAYLPQLAAYVALAAAMFLALTLQAFGSRVFPLVACGLALAFEIVFRYFGVLAQLVACTELLIVVGGFAAIVLARTVRHAN
jgi:hypothetical protein